MNISFHIPDFWLGVLLTAVGLPLLVAILVLLWAYIRWKTG